jgi:hypothetical protein
MALHHIRLTAAEPSAILAGRTMPRLAFRQALFRSPQPGWQQRLYRAAVVVTTTALGPGERTLAVDHQALRFALLYNATWPEPVFLNISRWPYKPLELRAGAPVAGFTVELRLRELKLGPEEWVELAFLG